MSSASQPDSEGGLFFLFFIFGDKINADLIKNVCSSSYHKKLSLYVFLNYMNANNNNIMNTQIFHLTEYDRKGN